MRRLVLRAIAIMAVLPSLASAQTAAPLIEFTPVDGGMTVIGIVTGLSTGTVIAEMTIDKSDPSGSFVTRQSREIAVSPNSRDILATTGFSAGPDAHITVEITLKAGKITIGHARTSLGPY